MQRRSYPTHLLAGSHLHCFVAKLATLPAAGMGPESMRTCSLGMCQWLSRNKAFDQYSDVAGNTGTAAVVVVGGRVVADTERSILVGSDHRPPPPLRFDWLLRYQSGLGRRLLRIRTASCLVRGYARIPLYPPSPPRRWAAVLFCRLPRQT